MFDSRLMVNDYCRDYYGVSAEAIKIITTLIIKGIK